MTNKSSFLGVGWDFSINKDSNGISPGPDGKIKLAKYEESVRQSIWIILGTAKGERLMRPNFGCGIHDMVFSTNNSSVKGEIKNSVRKALVNYEPRINLQNIDINNDGNKLEISINYEVIATNNVFNLVYPFYLESGA